MADELEGFSFERAKARADRIFDTTARILALAESEGLLPVVAAERIAEQRIAERRAELATG